MKLLFAEDEISMSEANAGSLFRSDRDKTAYPANGHSAEYYDESQSGQPDAVNFHFA